MGKFSVIGFEAHKTETPSPLSSESPSSNYRGFFNLAAIILFVTNFRLIIENLLRYGFLLSPPNPFLVLYDYRNWPCLSMLMFLQLFVAFAYFLEKRAAQVLSDKCVFVLHVLNVCTVIVLPLMLTFHTRSDIISGGILLLITLTTALKLTSFVHVITEVKTRKLTKDLTDIPDKTVDTVKKYPASLTPSVFWYFMVAPTLCFQFDYPRTPRIRKRWLVKRLIELVVSLSLMVILVQQYMFPLVEATIPLIADTNVSIWVLLEKHLRLSLPNLYVWLLMFFALFHCWLNVLGEVIRFADREFYLEWWNSKTFGEFWRLWNRPVHLWIMRHLYNPMRSAGYSVATAGTLVFFVSALGHEYVLSGACKLISYWAFLAMMVQVPMIVVMDKLKRFLDGTQVGNVVFWVSFCIVGEPLAVLIYAFNVLNATKGS